MRHPRTLPILLAILVLAAIALSAVIRCGQSDEEEYVGGLFGRPVAMADADATR